MKIQKLEIGTQNMQKQMQFYCNLLGMKPGKKSESSFEVIFGYSTIKFSEKKDFSPYHIAFHIPAKQEEKALKWIKKRVPVLNHQDEEIVDFSNWNAKSIYFYDPDKNIIEFISRENRNKPKNAVFTEESVLGIAEMGLATTDIPEVFLELNSAFGLEKYDGDFEKFGAVGDDQGLLITVNSNGKTWFPSTDPARVSDFKINFSHNSRQYGFQYKNGEIQHLINSEK